MTCNDYRPDHNGECLNCDEPIEAHPRALDDMRRAVHKVQTHAATLPEEQRIALGFQPRTVRGWLFWLRYWSPPAFWWLKVRTPSRRR